MQAATAQRGIAAPRHRHAESRLTAASRDARAAARETAPGMQPVSRDAVGVPCACGGGCPRCEPAAARGDGAREGGRGEHRAPDHVARVTAGAGRPLDAGSRAFFESRFGHDFGRVRLHTGAAAARSTRALDADAYTVGRHVVLGDGVRVGTAAGRNLLAHELAHVVQQGGLRVGAADSALEREADRAAETVTAGGAAAPSPGRTPALVGLRRRAPLTVQRGKTRPDCDSPQTSLPYHFDFNIQRSVFSNYIVRPAGGVFSGEIEAAAANPGLARTWVELRFFECGDSVFESDSVTIPADGKVHQWQVSGLDEGEPHYFQVVNKSLGTRIKGSGWFV